MRASLGDFARSGLEMELGPDVEAGVSAALEYCAGQIAKEQRPIDFPSFIGESTGGGAGTEMELAVPPEVEGALEVEVSRQGISIAQLIDHAVFVYLARVDELQAHG